MAWLWLGSILLPGSISLTAQLINATKEIERKAEEGANQKVDQTIDKGLNDIESGVKGLFKKKD